MSHDASTTTTNVHTTNIHQHHEDKAPRIDQSITKQVNGMHPLLVVALICVVVIGFAVIALILKPTPPPIPSVVSPLPLPQKSMADEPSPSERKPAVQTAPQEAHAKPPEAPKNQAPPQILLAETGRWKQGLFFASDSFQTGDLLTLRLRVSRACQMRIIYLPAIGDPLLLFPEKGGGSGLITQEAEILIPDPTKLDEPSADATAFELFHDSGSGPALTERVLIQISEETFATDDTVMLAATPYRAYSGLNLEQVRMRGVTRLKGLAASEAQAQMDKCVHQKILSFKIHP